LLAAYLDESFDVGNEGFYAVGAVVGGGWELLRAETLWKDLLAKHGIPVFKFNRVRRRPDVLRDFAEVIPKADLGAVGVIVEQATFRKALQGSKAHKQYKESPYLLLQHHIFVDIGMLLKEGRSGAGICFVCDENARYLDSMKRSYPKLKELNSQSAPYLGSCSLGKDEDYLPLQMADLVAGELRKNARAFIEKEKEGFSTTVQVWQANHCIGPVKYYDERGLKRIREIVDAGGKDPKTTGA
jgi:hypothetical protein